MAYYPQIMKVLEILEIARKDVPIYYRRVYTARTALDLIGKRTEKRIEFSIETKPTGAKEILVTLLEDIDYPLLPVQQALRDFILSMDRAGALPC